ncbi:LysR substrate-binding domain-containing protein, partial [Acinetobacter baumannii]|uniref:LysR substrate-binding domain-containing protein n=1 Tax=Acinetobacter baumannii TaxID=470 RepID=UPI002018612C
ALAAHLLLRHLGKFYLQYPELQLRILGDVHYASLQHRVADIAVRFGRHKDDYLIARKAGEVPFGIYAAQEYFDAIQEENDGWINV